MNATIIAGLAAASLLAAAGSLFLMLIRIGIARQERVGSLITRPRGICAALTRRILSLHASSGRASSTCDAASADGPSALRQDDGQ
jgi:hypothetical protein